MNDRYLYRAKRTDNGEWVEGFCFCMAHNDGIHIHHFIVPLGTVLSRDTPIGKIQVEVDPSTICQCSEIGKEVGINSPVWENEIYQWEDAAYGKCTGIIRYGKYLQDGSGNEYPEVNCYGFYAEVVKVEPYPGLDISDYPDYLKTISVLEVFIRKSGVTLLGNIFDNPELLEVGE